MFLVSNAPVFGSVLDQQESGKGASLSLLLKKSCSRSFNPGVL